MGIKEFIFQQEGQFLVSFSQQPDVAPTDPKYHFSIDSDSNFYLRNDFYGPRKEENHRSFVRIGPCKHP